MSHFPIKASSTHIVRVKVAEEVYFEKYSVDFIFLKPHF